MVLTCEGWLRAGLSETLLVIDARKVLDGSLCAFRTMTGSRELAQPARWLRGAICAVSGRNWKVGLNCAWPDGSVH